MVVLETDRLILRRLNSEDAAFVRTLLNEPSFLKNIGDKNVRSEEDAVAYIQTGPVASYERYGFGLNAVELRDTREPIGICGVLKRDTLPHPDIGFALLPSYWGKGYAVEAAAGVLNHARHSLKLARVLAICNQDNEASIGVLKKISMNYEGLINLTEGAPALKLFSIEFDPSNAT